MVFTIALLAIIKDSKCLKCPIKGKWVNCYIYLMDYGVAIKHKIYENHVKSLIHIKDMKYKNYFYYIKICTEKIRRKYS